MKKKIFLVSILIWGLLASGGLADTTVYRGPVSYTGDTTIIGDMTVGSTSAGKNLSVNATLGTELVTWTDAGWNEDGATWTFATSTLTHVTGNTTAVTATLGAAVVAGTTYKVTITGTGGGATASYTLGGVTGTTIAAAGAIAITDYITAFTAGSLIITPSNTCTVAITAISVKALTNTTGDLTVDGNFTARSQILAPITKNNSPAYSFALDPTSGFYYLPIGTVGLSTSGTLTHWWSSTAYEIYSDIARIKMGVAADVILIREAANSLQMGLDAATATAQTLKAADSSTGGVAGADLTIKGGTPGSGGTYGKVKIANGSTGGIFRAVAENTASIEADASTTITLSIPAGARLLGAQLRVDTALTATELWDAAFSGGSATAIAAAQAVAKQTKVNKLIVDEITSDVTNIAITKTGGGSFTAAGVIHAWAYYEVLDTLANAP